MPSLPIFGNLHTTDWILKEDWISNGHMTRKGDFDIQSSFKIQSVIPLCNDPIGLIQKGHLKPIYIGAHKFQPFEVLILKHPNMPFNMCCGKGCIPFK